MSFKNGHDEEPMEVECEICGVMSICEYVKGPGGAEALACDSCVEDGDDKADAQKEWEADHSGANLDR